MTTELLLWDDNPSEVDLLGFEAIAEPVWAALLREHLDPVCVGVFGPWGSGKTTVLRLIQKRLEGDENVLVVYTQPWAYDPATDPKATLIGEVLTEIRTRLEDTKSLTDTAKGRLVNLAKRVRWSRAISLAARTALTAQLPSVNDLEALFGAEDQITEPTLQGFKDEFGGLLADEALSSIRRVVVIVDDLDRCLPETVVDTLEAIKLFLSVPKMAFLVAADPDAITQAIANRYGTADQAHRLAARYLDKIVQIPIRIPVLGRTEVEAYVGQLLLFHRLNSGDLFETVQKHCAERRTAGERSLLDSLEIEGVDLAADLALAARLAPILYEEHEGNPRQIKRFLNAYWIRASVARSRGVEFEPAAFAKLMVLELLYPDNFKTLLGWLSAGELEEKLSVLEAGEGEHTAQLRRWAGLEPSLAGMEVGPYLVLAAALFGTTIAEESLPSHLREIASELTSPKDSERKAAQKALADLGLDDRSVLACHLSDVIRMQPTRQGKLAESLVSVINDSEDVAASAVPILRRIPHKEIEPALPITICPPGASLEAIVQLLTEWEASSDAKDDARNAARLALRRKAG